MEQASDPSHAPVINSQDLATSVDLTTDEIAKITEVVKSLEDIIS